MKYEIISDDILVDFLVNCQLLKKCKTVSVFTYTNVNAREVGRTRDKRRKPRREAEWFPAYRVFSNFELRV